MLKKEIKLKNGGIKCRNSFILLTNAKLGTRGTYKRDEDSEKWAYDVKTDKAGNISLSGNDFKVIEKVIYDISERFEIHVEEKSDKFLGMTLENENGSVHLHHSTLIERILEFFRMKEC